VPIETEKVSLLASRGEAAEALNLPLRTIDALAQTGELPSVRLANRVLFPWLDVIRLARVRLARARARPVPQRHVSTTAMVRWQSQ